MIKLAALLFCLTAQDSLPRLNILFIGNSYTYFNDLPRTLQQLGLQRREPVAFAVGHVWSGGYSLSRHWNDPRGVAQTMIKAGKWDYVVLQEQSRTPVAYPDTTLLYGKRFIELIRAAGAKPLIYLTWNRKGRSAEQDSLTGTLSRLAAETGARVVPVGPTWAALHELDKAIDLYAADGAHPNAYGSYAAAAAFYYAVLNELPDASRVIAFSAVPSLIASWERVEPFMVPRAFAAKVNQAVASAAKPK